MKRFVNLVLGCIVLLPLFTNLIIGLQYEANKDYIAAKLCVNRSAPKMKCNGHCYLSKQLKQQEEDGKQQLPKWSKEKEEYVSERKPANLVDYLPAYSTNRIIDYSVYNCADGYMPLIAHPPTV